MPCEVLCYCSPFGALRASDDVQVFKGSLSRSGTSGDDGVSFRYFAASELRDLFTGTNRNFDCHRVKLGLKEFGRRPTDSVACVLMRPTVTPTTERTP